MFKKKCDFAIRLQRNAIVSENHQKQNHQKSSNNHHLVWRENLKIITLFRKSTPFSENHHPFQKIITLFRKSSPVSENHYSFHKNHKNIITTCDNSLIWFWDFARQSAIQLQMSTYVQKMKPKRRLMTQPYSAHPRPMQRTPSPSRHAC